MKTPSIMAFGFIGVAATLAILIVTGGPGREQRRRHSRRCNGAAWPVAGRRQRPDT